MNKVFVKNTKDCVKDAIKKQIISNKDELLKDLETMDKNTVVVKVFDSIRYYNLPTKTRNALELANIEITPEILKEKGKEERVTAFSESMMTYAEDLLEQIKIDDETKKLYNKTINYSTMSISDSIRKFAEVGYILQQKDVVNFFETLFKSNSYNEEKSSAFQKSIYIYNTYQGGGKSTLMDSLKYGYENIGLKTEYTSLPGNDLHSTTIEAFGKNDICFIPDLSHDSIINKDKTKSILRHETVSYRPAYSSIERNIKAVALTMMVSNAEPRIINRCDRTLVPFEVIPVDTSATSAIFKKYPHLYKKDYKDRIVDLSGICSIKYSDEIIEKMREVEKTFNQNEVVETPKNYDKLLKISKVQNILDVYEYLESDYLLNSKGYIQLKDFDNICSNVGLMNSLDRTLKTLKTLECITSSGTDIKYRKWYFGDFFEKYTMEDILNVNGDSINGSSTLDEVGRTLDFLEALAKAFENVPPKKEMTDDEAFAAFDKLCNEQMQLFNTIDEPVGTYKDCYQTLPTNNDDDEFETVNPIKAGEKRCDDNVASKRNFVFEMDEESLQGQMKYTEKLIKEKVINRCVFSGSKSLHNRVTINFEPESKEEYKWIFKKLNEKYFDGKADKACSNLSRFTRKPNGYRKDKGKVQKLFFKAPFVLDCAYLHQEYLDYKKAEQERYAMLAAMSKSNNENIDFPISEIPNKIKSPKAELVELCLNGTASYDEGLEAFQYLVYLGYEYEEIINAIDWGKWNFTKSFYNTCKSK